MVIRNSGSYSRKQFEGRPGIASARRNAHDSSEFQVGGTSDLIGKGHRQFRPDTRPTWFIGDI